MLREEGEVNSGPHEQSRTTTLEIPYADVNLHELHNSPIGLISSPSYAEILKKKLIDTCGSSEEDSIEQITKKVGRKSRKEVREEEAERLKMQGSHATIEISIGRSKQNRPPKGGTTPFFSGK